jgi:hypothetical protein
MTIGSPLAFGAGATHSYNVIRQVAIPHWHGCHVRKIAKHFDASVRIQ